MLNAAQVETLQSSVPTDWSKFDQGFAPTDYGRGMFQGDDKLHVRFFTTARIDVSEPRRGQPAGLQGRALRRDDDARATRTTSSSSRCGTSTSSASRASGSSSRRARSRWPRARR